MFVVFVNRNDGLGWVRKFKKSYATAGEATTASSRCKNRTWIVRVKG